MKTCQTLYSPPRLPFLRHPFIDIYLNIRSSAVVASTFLLFDRRSWCGSGCACGACRSIYNIFGKWTYSSTHTHTRCWFECRFALFAYNKNTSMHEQTNTRTQACTNKDGEKKVEKNNIANKYAHVYLKGNFMLEWTFTFICK